jgi:hypothetical protein
MYATFFHCTKRRFERGFCVLQARRKRRQASACARADELLCSGEVPILRALFQLPEDRCHGARGARGAHGASRVQGEMRLADGARDAGSYTFR